MESAAVINTVMIINSYFPEMQRKTENHQILLKEKHLAKQSLRELNDVNMEVKLIGWPQSNKRNK